MDFSKMPEPIVGFLRFYDKLRNNGYDENNPNNDIVKTTFDEWYFAHKYGDNRLVDGNYDDFISGKPVFLPVSRGDLRKRAAGILAKIDQTEALGRDIKREIEEGDSGEDWKRGKT